MESHNPLGEDREFDRLLRQARWPEPQGDQIARLGEHWQAIARRRRMRFRYGALAMAASIAMFATVLALRQGAAPPEAITATPTEPTGNHAQKDRIEVVRVDTPPVEPSAQSLVSQPSCSQPSGSQPSGSQPPVVASIEPRDPKPAARTVLRTAKVDSRRHHGAPTQLTRARQQRIKSEDDVRLLDELMVALVADPAADVDEPLAAVESDFWRYEPSFWPRVEQGSPQQRLAAALVIARIGTAQSLPLFAGLHRDPATHPTAIAGLCRLASPADLRGLVIVEPDAALRQNLLTALLARRSDDSVGLFLELVNDEAFRAEALAASSAMADPPVDLLIAFLESPRGSLRLAAAQSLGSLPEADIASRMSDSVFRGSGRQEALLALLLSPDAQSARFLDAARQDRYLVASVYAAEQQLHSLTLAER